MQNNYIQQITENKKMNPSIYNQINTYFEQIPIEKAWLFGSYARNEENANSDIDLLVQFVQPNNIDLFDFAGYVYELEEIAGRKVDLVIEHNLRKEVENNVNSEKILIYERKTA